jgi:uncharacterized protein (DUF1330 family)
VSAYCLFDIFEVIDAKKLEQYRAGVLATVKKYHGRYLVLGGICERVEGDWQPNFPVLIEFHSLSQAYAWYNSDEYKELKALRIAGSKSNAVFMETEANDFVTGE